MNEPSVDDDLRWLLGMEFYPIAIGGRVQQPDRLYYESLPGDKARIARIAAEIDRLRAELNLWKPLTAEEAERAMDEAEAMPIDHAEIARIVERVSDPTYRPTEPEHVLLAVRVRQLEAELAEKRNVFGDANSEGTQAVGYWNWQGDGHDEPESLTCPVLMSADSLRSMLAELATANKREEIAIQNTKRWINAQNETQKRLATATQRLETAERALRDIADYQTTGVYGLAQQALDDMEKVK